MRELIAALIGDLLASSSFPLSGTVPAGGVLALNKLLKTRAEIAREILLQEIARGRSSHFEIPADEAAAITFRYLRAATEGAARLNLRLLAGVIAGNESGKSSYADDFLRWADVLSSLSRDEVVVLGEIMRRAAAQNFEPDKTGRPWVETKAGLAEKYGMESADAEATASALLRTGLLQILGGLMDYGQAYIPSRNLRTLHGLIDIEAVVARSDKED